MTNTRAITGPLTWFGRNYSKMGYHYNIMVLDGDDIASLSSEGSLTSVPQGVRELINSRHPYRTSTDFELIDGGKEALAHWLTHPLFDTSPCDNEWCHI